MIWPIYYVLWLIMALIGLVVVPVGIKWGFTGLRWPWGNDNDPNGHPEVSRYVWYALRNPISNAGKLWFCKSVTASVKLYGNLGTSTTGTAGFYFLTAGRIWEFHCVLPIGFGYCYRARLGWKLRGLTVGDKASFAGEWISFRKFG